MWGWGFFYFTKIRTDFYNTHVDMYFFFLQNFLEGIILRTFYLLWCYSDITWEKIYTRRTSLVYVYTYIFKKKNKKKGDTPSRLTIPPDWYEFKKKFFFLLSCCILYYMYIYFSFLNETLFFFFSLYNWHYVYISATNWL